MVTAETAVTLPVLVALVIALGWGLSLAVTQVRLVDAAREGARMVARGEDPRAVQAAVEEMAPGPARVRVEVPGVTNGSGGPLAESTSSPPDSGVVRVTVVTSSRLDLPLLRSLPSFDVSASATSGLEEVAP